MDSTLFGPRSAGDLVAIEHGESAFMPQRLPLVPPLQLTEQQWRLFADAKQSIGALSRLLSLPHLPIEPGLFLSSLKREESLRSSSIEGTHAEPDELLLHEENPDESSSSAAAEVANYKSALELGTTQYRKSGLTNNLVRSLHQRLMSGVRGENKEPGAYRTRQVYIGTDHRFIPPPAHAVQELMDNLIEFGSSPANELPFSAVAFVFHYQFETIHPFLDGNGRVGRLLLSIMLSEASELNEPWFFLSPYFERHRREYVDRLFEVSASSDWDGWIMFCIRAMKHQTDRTQQQLIDMLELYTSWLNTLFEAGARGTMRDLIQALFKRPILNTDQAQALLGVKSPATVRKDLSLLQAEGIVKRHKVGRDVWYVSPQILQIVHGDINT